MTPVEVTHGTQGQTVEVRCVNNMTTADGRTRQNVTCGPGGWSPPRLDPCHGQWTVATA